MESEKKKIKLDNLCVCTACSQRLDVAKPETLRQHPTLKVLLCKRCYSLRTTKEIEVGEDGCDEACQWCALEGDLICCDFCSHAFCKLCIRRNLGRAHLNTLLNSDEEDKWKCYICEPEPLQILIKACLDIFEEFGISDDPALQLNMDVENIEEEADPDEDVEVDDEDAGQDLVYLQTPSGEVIAVPAAQAKKLMEEEDDDSIASKSPVKSITNNVIKNGNETPVKVPKTTKPAANATATARPMPAKPSVNTTSSSGPKIDEYNVWLVLEKLFASTQSMSLLLGSLKDDLNNAEGSETMDQQRHNVANKLWRALLAFRRSFSEVESSCRLPLITSGRGDGSDDDDDDEDDDDDDDSELENEEIIGSFADHGGIST